jgi:hypothetical protein
MNAKVALVTLVTIVGAGSALAQTNTKKTTSPQGKGPSPEIVECYHQEVGCACGAPILKLSCNEAEQCVRREGPIHNCKGGAAR